MPVELTNLANLNVRMCAWCFQTTFLNLWFETVLDVHFYFLCLLEKLKEGKKNILAFAPSFVTDCLETVIEIGEDYQELFSENGGNKIQLVESLNASDSWVNAIVEIIDENKFAFCGCISLVAVLFNTVDVGIGKMPIKITYLITSTTFKIPWAQNIVDQIRGENQFYQPNVMS